MELYASHMVKDAVLSRVQPDPLPKLVYVELADYCNLNCMFCGRGAYVAATGDTGGFTDIEKLQAGAIAPSR